MDALEITLSLHWMDNSRPSLLSSASVVQRLDQRFLKIELGLSSPPMTITMERLGSRLHGKLRK